MPTLADEGRYVASESTMYRILREEKHWYNHEHKHSNLKFVSPAQRHCGADQSIFAKRIVLYE